MHVTSSPSRVEISSVCEQYVDGQFDAPCENDEVRGISADSCVVDASCVVEGASELPVISGAARHSEMVRQISEAMRHVQQGCFAEDESGALLTWLSRCEGVLKMFRVPREHWAFVVKQRVPDWLYATHQERHAICPAILPLYALPSNSPVL